MAAASRRRRSFAQHSPVLRQPHQLHLLFRSAAMRAVMMVGLILAGAVALVAVVTLASVVFVVVATSVIVVMMGIAATKDIRQAIRSRSPSAASSKRRPKRVESAQVVWSRARKRFAALRTEYANYECDPMAVLRLPALADVRVPSTARFVEAFAEAQALETDAVPSAQHAADFAAAVDKAERAWRAAREAAERIRLSRLSPTERATVDRVVKLLTTARETDNDAERYAAYARARSELAKLDRSGVIPVPRPAQAALDAAARGELSA